MQGVHPKVSGSFLLAATAVALCRRAGDTGRDGKAQGCRRTEAVSPYLTDAAHAGQPSRTQGRVREGGERGSGGTVEDTPTGHQQPRLWTQMHLTMIITISCVCSNGKMLESAAEP